MRVLVAGSALLLLLVCVGVAVARGQAAGQRPAVGSTGLYSIEGRLVSSSGREHLSGIPVALTSPTGTRAGTCITDNEGSFAFWGLHDGTYRLEFALRGNGAAAVEIQVLGGPVRDLIIDVDALAEKSAPGAKPTVAVWALRVPREAQAAFDEGLKALERKEWSRSVAAFRKAIEIYPQHAAAHAALGSAYLLSGKPAEAAPAFEKALQIDASLANACLGLGSIHAAAKRHPEAEEYLLRAQGLKPDDWRIYLQLGENYFHWGRYTQAEESLRRAHEWRPPLPRLHLLLMNTLVLLEKHSAALAEMDDFLQLFPADPFAAKVRQKRDALSLHVHQMASASTP